MCVCVSVSLSVSVSVFEWVSLSLWEYLGFSIGGFLHQTLAAKQKPCSQQDAASGILLSHVRAISTDMEMIKFVAVRIHGGMMDLYKESQTERKTTTRVERKSNANLRSWCV